MRIRAAILAVTITALVVASGCDSQAASMEPSHVLTPLPAAPAQPQSLSERAALAMQEKRIHTPAGNNAVEYYLAVRAELPDDPSTVSALQELQPYLLVLCEQATARGEWAEAQRLLELATRVDAASSSLSRLRDGLRIARRY